MEQNGTRTLVIQTAFLGDLLLGIPLFKELRHRNPQGKLILFCRKGLGDLMLKLGLFDEVIEADKASKQSWKEAESRAKNTDYDLLICPHESLRSRLLAKSLRAKRKIGYRKLLNQFIFDDQIDRPMSLPEALRQLALLEPLDSAWAERLKEFQASQRLPGGQKSDGELLPLPEWADMSAPKLSQLRKESREKKSLTLLSSERVKSVASKIGAGVKPLVFLAPGSVWNTKMWTPKGYAEVAREFQMRGYQAVIIGAPNEKEICEQVMKDAPGSISIAGEVSLFESAELLSLGEILFSNDSGSMHVAAAGGVPTVSVFGPTVLELGYRPWQTNAKIVQISRTELPCRPCGTHGANKCPLGHHNCMKWVKSEDVIKASSALI